MLLRKILEAVFIGDGTFCCVEGFLFIDLAGARPQRRLKRWARWARFFIAPDFGSQIPP